MSVSVTKITVVFVAKQQKDLQRLFNYFHTCNTSISKNLNLDLPQISIPKEWKENLETSKPKITQLKPIGPESKRGKIKFSFLCKFDRVMDHPTMTDLDAVFKSISPECKYFYILEDDEHELYVNTDIQGRFLSTKFKLIKQNKETGEIATFYFSSIKNMNRYILQSYPGINLSPDSKMDQTFDRFAHYLLTHYQRKFPMIQILVFVYDRKMNSRYDLPCVEEPAERSEEN